MDWIISRQSSVFWRFRQCPISSIIFLISFSFHFFYFDYSTFYFIFFIWPPGVVYVLWSIIVSLCLVITLICRSKSTSKKIVDVLAHVEYRFVGLGRLIWLKCASPSFSNFFFFQLSLVHSFGRSFSFHIRFTLWVKTAWESTLDHFISSQIYLSCRYHSSCVCVWKQNRKKSNLLKQTKKLRDWLEPNQISAEKGQLLKHLLKKLFFNQKCAQQFTQRSE